MHLPAPPLPGPVLVGFSGGLDSSVLLHLLHAGAAPFGLRAIHVHHGLQPQADAWATHCQQVCDQLGVPLTLAHVSVERNSALGLEGAARAARHTAFAQTLQPGEILALAHHQDDQAETFLLRALRGSGVDGLAAMQPWRHYSPGWLWRPLLDTPRADLLIYAQTHALSWLDDPSNFRNDFDRNFLRNTLLPLLQQRWPQAARNLSRSAALSAQASALLLEDDTHALRSLQHDAATLRVPDLRQLTPERRARVLRHWIATLVLPPLPGSGIHRIERDLLHAPDDAHARFDWHGASIRRWRSWLHAHADRPVLSPDWETDWDGVTPLQLPTGDTLILHGPRFPDPVRVCARRGGERITLPKRTHSHSLKHVLQDIHMPPWQRERLPLLTTDAGELLAAGDQLLSARMAHWLQQHAAYLHWQQVT